MFPVFSREGMAPESLQDPAFLRQRAVDAFRLILKGLTECGPVVACIDLVGCKPVRASVAPAPA